MHILRTYLVSSPLIALYLTQIVGDARNPPTLLAGKNFTGLAVIGMLYAYKCNRTGEEYLADLDKFVNHRRKPIHPEWLGCPILRYVLSSRYYYTLVLPPIP